jgi:hypothetical protein
LEWTPPEGVLREKPFKGSLLESLVRREILKSMSTYIVEGVFSYIFNKGVTLDYTPVEYTYLIHCSTIVPKQV